jgi:hypothetical protein
MKKENYNYRFWVSALSAACYLAKAGHEVVVLKMHHWRKSKTIKDGFIWGQVGTGCQMFSIVSLLILVKNNRLLRAHKVISCLSVVLRV